jgi:oxygen-independent coproporphyrinogen-3 oxidase
MQSESTLGLYVSVPFCRAKCSFCNFASGVGNGAEMERYVSLLCNEIAQAGETSSRLAAPMPRRVDSVYFGGGTPSLLEPAQLQRIFTALRNQFDLDADAEITMEAAPGQISGEVLEQAMRLGVNRVSLGVQSFVDRECSAVGRLHTEKECVREIVRLGAEGVAEVGADLIAGLPYQTEASWAHSLEVASSVGLTHLSVYMLEIDEDSRLGREVLQGGGRFHAPGVPADDLSAEMYEMACQRLPGMGFAQYEISNFATHGHRSRHNLKYWQRMPYLGFGLDAHSMLLRPGGAVRFANPDERKAYPASPEVTEVGEREAFEETVFLGLRLIEGLRSRDLDPAFLHPEWSSAFEANARTLVHEGLMSESDGRWRLTLRGRMVSNDVFGHLLSFSNFPEKPRFEDDKFLFETELKTSFFELTGELNH